MVCVESSNQTKRSKKWYTFNLSQNI